MKTPNPQLKNTCIYVGNDEQLRKRAIEYYEVNGYRFKDDEMFYEYIGTFESIKDKESSSFPHSMIVGYNKTIITLPEPETKYPCMMLVWDGLENKAVERLVICKFENRYIAKDIYDETAFYSYANAKPITTKNITTEELIEYYEKNTNTKVKLI